MTTRPKAKGGRWLTVLALSAGLAPPAAAEEDGIRPDAWQRMVDATRADQPDWSSPLVTTTGLLEQRLRLDIGRRHAGNGADTTLLDGGRGLDLIVAPATEFQFGAPTYNLRSPAGGTPAATGFTDWPFLRIERRLASRPAGEGNYVLTVWLTAQAPAGTAGFSNNAWTWSPALAFGKGWGAFDIQGTIGAVLPASHTDILGHQIQTNLALQYHCGQIFWPDLEASWTYDADGQRGGLSQVHLTPGLVVGRIPLGAGLAATLGIGYQTALTPSYRPRPLTPAYDHAWLFTTRLNF